MANQLFNMLGGQNQMNPMTNLVNQLNQFRQSFSGDPKQQVQQLLNSGRRGHDARTGRYVSQDNRGYSRAMDKQRMIGKLEDMMDDAPSEKERRALQQCVTKLEQQ